MRLIFSVSSAVNNIGQVLTNETWQFMDPCLSATSLTGLFEYYTGEVLNTFCPEKRVFNRPDENPFVTEEMKTLKRSIMREYEKRNISSKYKEMKARFKHKMEIQVLKYKEKVLDDVKNGNRSCTYSALRKLGLRTGDKTKNTFILSCIQIIIFQPANQLRLLQTTLQQ